MTTVNDTRAVLWLDPRTSAGVDETGHPVRASVGGGRRVPQLVDYLETARAHGTDAAHITVYLVGARPTPPRGGKVADWLLAPTPGWTPGAHYMDADRPVGRFTHADTARRVDVRRAAELFDVDDAETACTAWNLARAAWRRVFDFDLLSSLVASGRIALARCGATQWPEIDDDTAALIRNTAPQHRIELAHETLNPLDLESEAPGFVYLDARWSYVALLRELHVGTPTALHGEAAAKYAELYPYDRARYLVRFRAPDDWRHVGVFLAKHPDGVRWCAPRTGETWCDSAELMVARDNGWHVDIREGMIWDGARRFRALDTWRDRMLRVADEIGRLAPHVDLPGVGAAARAVVRGVILQTLGAMHSTGAHNVVYVDNASDVPAHARNTIEPRGTGYTYVDTVPISGPARVLLHPEITAQVWGRAHARILSHKIRTTVAYLCGPGMPGGVSQTISVGALHVPPSQLIAIHGDALYLTRDPRWPDDGKVGRMRVKGSLPGPIPWPTTMRDVYALARKSERGNE